MTRGPPAAQVVVIQGRQIIMDQRIGMQHFEGGTQIFDSRGKGAGDHPACLHAQDRPQAFTARKYAMAHGLVNRDRMLGYRRQQAFQRPIGQSTACFQGVLEHDGEYNKARLASR